MKLDQNSFMENNSAEKFSPWTTYSDIFCSLMMVFVLLFSYAMIQYSLSSIQKKQEAESQQVTIVELQNMQVKYESEIQALILKLDEAEKKLSDQTQVVSLQSELSNAQYELQVVIAEKKNLIEELDSVSAELADLVIVADEREKKIVENNQQLIILNAENQDLAAQIEALTEQNGDLEAQILLLESDISRLSEEAGGKDGSLEEQKLQLIALSDKNEDLEAQLVILSDKNTDLNAQISAAQEENSSLISEIDQAKSEIDRLNAMIVVLQGDNDDMSQQIVDLAAENDKLSVENNDLRARIAALNAGNPVELEKPVEEAVAGIRLQIIDELSNALKESGVKVVVDSESGAIMLNSEVLFDVGKSDLKAVGKDFLDSFFPVYFDVLAKGSSAEYIAQITVEGHTDTTGDYRTNLGLSMRRAQAVLEYCASMLDVEDQEVLIRMFNASGCAYAKPIYENGVIDMEKSRRVEMKFTLKDAEMIEEIRRMLEE